MRCSIINILFLIDHNFLKKLGETKLTCNRVLTDFDVISGLRPSSRRIAFKKYLHVLKPTQHSARSCTQVSAQGAQFNMLL